MDTSINQKSVNNLDVERGAKEFEMFWLRPKKMALHETVLRLQINKRWGGWKLKDELVNSLGLEIGDTINTEVSVLNAPGLIADEDDTDLFASGEGADWLLDNNIGLGSIIDAKVRFLYTKAPVGGIDGKDVWKVSLVFLEGYSIVRERTSIDEQFQLEETPALAALKRLLSD